MRPLAIFAWCLALASVAKGAAHEVHVMAPLAHTLSGWGLYPVEFYFDTINDRPEIQRRLLVDLKPTVVKLRLQQALKKSPHAELDAATFRQGIKLPVESLVPLGIAYILAADSPPLFWKTYPTIDGHQDYNPARLVEGYEHAFVDFIVTTLVRIRDERLPLPVGICFQDSPSLMISRPPGCPYTPEQWVRVLGLLRRQLDAAKLSGIPIIGPDDLSLPSSMTMAAPLIAAPPSDRSPLGVFMTQLRLSPEAATSPMVSPTFDYLHASRTPVWTTGSANYHARSEWEACLTAAQSLAGSFADLGASVWFWRLGYSAEPSVESLVHGEGETTRLYALLRTLWDRVRPGATIHPVRFGASAPLAPPHFAAANGVAFGVPRGRVYVLINPGAEAVALRLDQPAHEAWSVSHSRPDAIETAYVPDGAGTLLTLPPQSIAVVGTRSN